MEKKRDRKNNQRVKHGGGGAPRALLPRGLLSNLSSSISRGNGRSRGFISVDHIDGGWCGSPRFRLLDLARKVVGEEGTVLRIEFDPNRGSYIALIFYSGLGLFSYILAPEGLRVGMAVCSFRGGSGVRFNPKIFDRPGCTFPLRSIPLSIPIHNVELRPGQGGKVARAAGVAASVVRRFDGSSGGRENFVGVRLPSGKLSFVNSSCRGTIGQVSHVSHQLESNHLAGKNSRLGFRPRVRGVAMNPVDHPHGGGEGKTSGGRPSVSRWGWLTKGGRTKSRKSRGREVAIMARIGGRRGSN